MDLNWPGPVLPALPEILRPKHPRIMGLFFGIMPALIRSQTGLCWCGLMDARPLVFRSQNSLRGTAENPGDGNPAERHVSPQAHWQGGALGGFVTAFPKVYLVVQ